LLLEIADAILEKRKTESLPIFEEIRKRIHTDITLVSPSIPLKRMFTSLPPNSC